MKDLYVSYNQIHELVCSLAKQVKQFKPDVIVAIGGGGINSLRYFYPTGFIPARILRTFLKIPILAVGI